MTAEVKKNGQYDCPHWPFFKKEESKKSGILLVFAPINVARHIVFAHDIVAKDVQPLHDVAQLADDKFSPVFLRNTTAYGVSPRLRFDIVLNNLVAWAFTTGRVHSKSDGSPWRPIVYPFKLAMPVATLLLLLQGLSEFMKSVWAARKGEWL